MVSNPYVGSVDELVARAERKINTAYEVWRADPRGAFVRLEAAERLLMSAAAPENPERRYQALYYRIRGLYDALRR